MRIDSGQFDVTISSVANADALSAELEPGYASSILIDGECEFPSSFYVIKVEKKNAKDQFRIGIYSENTGIPPCVHIEPNLLVIGNNTQVTGIDLLEESMRFRVDLGSCFYSIQVLSTKMLLILFELGALIMDLMGNVLTSAATGDVLAEWIVAKTDVQLIDISNTVVSIIIPDY